MPPIGGIHGRPAASVTIKRIAMIVSGLILAGLVGAGAVGVFRYVSTFWLYRGFPPPSAPKSVLVRGPGGIRRVPVVLPTVQTFTVTSPALGGYADRVDVVLPPGYADHPTRRYPVIYLLHGFPGEPWQFLDIGQVGTTEATLVASGRMRPVIMVMPTGTRSFLADEEWANGIRRGSRWESFVADDLVRAIGARYRTIVGGHGRGIAGLSEGGYGALNIGLHHPGEFGLLESWSGYMRAEHRPSLFGHSAGVLARNSPAVVAASVASRLRADHTYIWFYIGSRDRLVPQNRAFNAELTALGVAHHFFEVPGGHSWQLWRSQMRRALITASEHLSHD
jgi:enterochelin esterase-like enzyme